MALTNVSFPQGIKISNDSVSATVTDSGGDALFTTGSAHGLSNDDVIYIKSLIDKYNGFMFVEVVSPTTFTVRAEFGTVSPTIAFLKEGTVTYYESLGNVIWSCVHLPIVLKHFSRRWPTNIADTARTVSSFANASGFVRLNLSGSISSFLAGAANELDFIKISGAFSSEVNGVFQIFDIISSTSIVINLAYNSTYSFSGGSVIFHYQNYVALIRVYAGFKTDHPYYSEKPLELVDTLQIVPDSDSMITYSVSELIKSFVEIKNNLLLGTLPDNIDAYTQFYIETSESFDKSNGYVLGTYTDVWQPDVFTGYAVNAKLPFKNKYSGYLSDYIMRPNFFGKFLTMFAIPVLFYSCESEEMPYQDISCIIDIEVSGIENGTFEGGLSPAFNSGGSNPDWTWAPNKAVSTLGNNFAPTDLLLIPFNSESGTNYTFQLAFNILDGGSGAGSSTRILFSLSDGVTFTDTVTANSLPLGNGQLRNINITPTADWPYISIAIVAEAASSWSRTFELDSIAKLLPSSDFDSIYMRRIFYNNGSTVDTVDTEIEYNGPGVYRLELTTPTVTSDYEDVYLFGTSGIYEEEEIISETKRINHNCICENGNQINLSWLIPLGGFDSFTFTAGKDILTDVIETGEQSSNVFPEWPVSYGEFSDTINRQTFRESREQIRVRSQHVTIDELDAILYLRKSPLVQIINSRYDRRTVIVDKDSFVHYREFEDKMYSVEFTISYTDNNPSQTV